MRIDIITNDDKLLDLIFPKDQYQPEISLEDGTTVKLLKQQESLNIGETLIELSVNLIKIVSRPVIISLVETLLAEGIKNYELRNISISKDRAVIILDRRRTDPDWDINEGEVREFCFLEVDVVDHSRISRDNARLKVEETFGALKDCVEERVRICEGQVWSWEGDGGLCVFFGDDQPIAEFGVECALEIIKGLGEFNETNNSLNQEIKVRIALHRGTARYLDERGNIHSSAINFVAHLERERTYPNTISISRDVYYELRDDLRSLFRSAGQFEEKEIFTNATACKEST